MTNPDQVAIYTTSDGVAHVRLQLKDGSAWLNTTQMAELFNVGAPAINHHIREILRDGELAETTCKKLLQQPGQDRRTNHYNLDMILAVGYRVRGPRGAQFRKWATEVLREYLTKGFALDDQRLKNDGVDTHFDELLERIREIRVSERQFFRKICDVISATWDGELPHKSDMEVAKNYLTEDEARQMRRLTTMFLDYAEDQAERGKTLLLSDWMEKADAWLVFNEREVLKGYGKRQHKQAVTRAKAEWDAYQRRLDAEVNTLDMKQLEHEVKALKRRENPVD